MIFRDIWFCCAAVAIVCAHPVHVEAQLKVDYGDGKHPWIWEFTVEPASESEPALAHPLLPPRQSLKPGNAVPHYYRAMMMLFDGPEAELKELDELTELISTKPRSHQIPVERVRKLMSAISNLVYELQLATSRESCDWSFRWQDHPEFKTSAWLQVPEFKKARRLADLLRLKARLEMADRKHAEALQTLQMGFRLGQDLARDNSLLAGLVGIAICNEMAGQIAVVVTEEGAPNLYWATAALSGRLIDLRPALEQETSATLLFSLLKSPEQSRTDEEWKQALGEAYLFIQNSNGTSQEPPKTVVDSTVHANAMQIVTQEYPRVKQELERFGFNTQQIENMTEVQAIAVHEARVARYKCDELTKWIYAPYWQARPYLQQQTLRKDVDAQRLSQLRESMPLFDVVAPKIDLALFAAARLERRLVWLQMIEALRMHAASNGGKFPTSLQDVKLVPIPSDPMTGQAIDYRLEGETAVMTFVSGNPQIPNYGEIIRITLRKKN